MSTTVTLSEFAARSEEILRDVIANHASINIAEDGKVVAVLQPPPAQQWKTWGEIVDEIGHLRMPDPDFADDLEAINRDQAPIGDPPPCP